MELFEMIGIVYKHPIVNLKNYLLKNFIKMVQIEK